MTSPPRRSLRSSVLAVVAGALLLGAVVLLPDLTPSGLEATIGQDSVRATVVERLGPDGTGQEVLLVELSEGPEAGERIEAAAQDVSGALPGGAQGEPYEPGDEVAVTRFTGPAGDFAVVSEPWRVPLLGVLVGVFAIAVLIVGGLRGLRALLALALTLASIVKIVVPLLLAGWNPVLLAVGLGAAITLASLAITEGANRVTLAAVLGTFMALALTAGLAAFFNSAAGFTALQGSEEISFLIPLIGERVDLQGILLAAIVFGALGVLDDVTVTQAAAVEQLHQAEPGGTRRSVIRRAMRIGRSHIAATVNTLVLAYLGAGLPLLLLFALSGQQPLMVVNGELLAVELIRALVGSIGIVAAVPLTTFIAALLIVPAGHRPATSAS